MPGYTPNEDDYRPPLESNVEVLINLSNGTSLVTNGTNMTYRQAANALPGCTHCMLRCEGRFTYYRVNHEEVWTYIVEEGGEEIPPELKAFQMIL